MRVFTLKRKGFPESQVIGKAVLQYGVTLYLQTFREALGIADQGISTGGTLDGGNPGQSGLRKGVKGIND